MPCVSILNFKTELLAGGYQPSLGQEARTIGEAIGLSDSCSNDVESKDKR